MAMRFHKITSLRNIRSFSSVTFAKTGDPYKVLNIEKSSGSKKLNPNEVELKMLFSSINSIDLSLIEGFEKIPLPSIAGRDGLAEVMNIGSSVKSMSKGDWVVPLPGSNVGTWTSTVCTDHSNVIGVPKDIPEEYASNIGTNASCAYRLMNDFVKMKEGDVIIQSGANSSVGLSIIQMAKKMKIKTINVLRPRPEEDYSAETVATVGGDIVVTSDYLHTKEFYELISDMNAPVLALDCVGGKTGTDMLRSLGENGTMVTYGCLSTTKTPIPQSVVKAKNLKLKEFSLADWAKKSKHEDRMKMINEIAEMIRSEELIMFFETHPFSQLSNALDRYYEPYKFRKILLDMSI
mmetsp:Transcript_101/g.138  ORF Transcript_101/g.138 Transcript_101/m.138 type:complete len:349 (+) Transcript_101:31-1077(+)